MAVRKKARDSTVRRAAASLPTASSPSGGATETEHDETARLDQLRLELEETACSKRLRAILDASSHGVFTQGEELLLARCAVKFGIEERAWVQRALDGSTSKGQAIAALVDQGVRETDAVARAIVDEIQRWDSDWIPLSAVRIQELRGFLCDLLQQEPRNTAETLIRLAKVESESSPRRMIVDAILGKNESRAIAARARWESNALAHNNVIGYSKAGSLFTGSLAFETLFEGPDATEAGRAVRSEMDEVSKEKETAGSLSGRSESNRTHSFDALLASLPTESAYSGLSGRLTELMHEFRLRIVKILEPQLNAYLNSPEAPHATYEEKKALAKWVNEELRQFGLAIKCPKTGLPAILVAGPGDDPHKGRFQLDVLTADGRRKRTISSVDLPRIELTLAAFHRGTETRWVDRVGEQQNEGTKPRP